jgi:hypothetical protein
MRGLGRNKGLVGGLLYSPVARRENKGGVLPAFSPWFRTSISKRWLLRLLINRHHAEIHPTTS